MKKLILAIFVMSLWQSIAAQQFKLYTDNGKKEVKTAACGLSDLKLSLVVTSEMMKYDKIAITVKVTKNNKANNYNVVEKDLSKSMLKVGKKISLWVKKPGGGSDFKYPFSDLDIESPCSKKKRNERFWYISFAIYGMEFTGYEYVPQSDGSTLKNEKYQYTELNDYADYLKFDYGEVSNYHTSPNKTIMFSRFSDDRVSLRPQDGESLMYLFLEERDYVFAGVSSFNSSELSKEEAKEDVILYFRKLAEGRSSNGRKLGDVKYDWKNMLFYEDLYCPYLVKKLGKSKNPKFDKLMKDLSKKPLEWQQEEIGGTTCDVIVLSVYSGVDFYRDASKNLFIPKSHQAEIRELLLFFERKMGIRL